MNRNLMGAGGLWIDIRARGNATGRTTTERA